VSRRRRLLEGAALGFTCGLFVRELGLAAVLSYHKGPFLLILGFGIAGALLGLTPLRRALPVSVAALVALWLIVALSPLTRLLSDGLVRRDPPGPADAVFVLASDLQIDGDLTSTSLGRLTQGVALLRAGHAPRLVVANVARRPSHEAAVRRTLDALGVSTELIAVGPVSTTRDEAVALAELFRARGWRRVLLVTSSLHSRRAAATFARLGLEVVSSPARETDFDSDVLSQRDDRVRAFGSVLHERVGLLVYGWRGWL
jgi:uncharacterized SAM-binding protein YcdF (DUF218 family)